MEIWLIQVLCPQRHAIAASPYVRGTTDPADHERDLLAQLDACGIERRCGICGSTELRCEHRRLPFTDLATALAALREVEIDQLLTRAEIDRTRNNRN